MSFSGIQTDNNTRLLIVNAEETKRKALVRIFADSYPISEAGNSVDALALLEQDCTYCAVVLDLMTPETDGVTFLNTLKSDKRFWHIDVIADMVRGEEENELKALELGVTDFIYRPYCAELVRHRVVSVVEHRSVVDTCKKSFSLQAEKDLFAKVVAGGMMGGYLEENFPFYFINDTMLSYLGYISEQEFVEDNKGFISNCMHPDDKNMVDAAVGKQLKTSDEYNVDYRMRKKDGSYIWVHDVGKVIIAENGKPAITSVCSDVSEQVVLQHRAEESIRDLQSIVDNIPGGVAKIILRDGKIIPGYISDSLCRLMNDSKENLMKLYEKDAMAGVHPEDYDRVDAVFKSSMQTGQPINSNYRLCNSEGEYRWVNNRSSLFFGEKGSVTYYAVYIDMTEEMEMREKTRQISQERELIYNTIPGAVFKCRFDSGWTVLFANDGLFHFLGYTREEFRTRFGNKMSGVIYPEDGAIMVEKLSAQLVNSNIVQNENRLICKDGSIKWISIHAQLLEDENSEQYFYCTFVDITDQKRAESELANTQQKLRAAITHAGLSYWEYDMINQRAYMNPVSAIGSTLQAPVENYPQSVYDAGIVARESISAYQKLIEDMKNGYSVSSADVKMLDANGNMGWKRIHFTALFDKHHKPFWAVATAENIGEYKELEQQFAVAAAQTGVESWIYDFATRTLTRKSNVLTGHSAPMVVENVPESLVKQKIVHPDDAAAFYALYDTIRRGEERASLDLRMYRADSDSYVYHRMDYTVLFDKNGKPERAIGTAVDISEQLMMKKRYQEAVEYHHNTASEKTLASGYCNITKNRMLEFHSADNVDHIAELGEDRDHFFMILSDCIPDGEDRRKFLNVFLSERAINAYAQGFSKQIISTRIQLANGLCKYVQFVLEILKQPDTGDLTGFFLMTDTTEQIIYHKAVDTVIENYCDWIMDVDINQDYYTMPIIQEGLDNPLPLSGTFSRINKEYAKTLADEQSVHECIEKLSYSYMLEHLDREGTYWFYYRTVENEELRTKKIQVLYIDKPLGHVGLIRIDVTITLQEEQQKNEALRYALVSSERANKAKTDFLSRMSHDVRTPMNAIIGMTELSKREIDNKEKLMENLDVIDSSSRLLLGIINDVLDMSQIESGNMILVQETFDCFAECQNIIEMSQVMFGTKKQIFEVKKNFIHQFFVGDIVRLKRVMVNLLNNASKFSPEGGKIILTAEEEANLNPKFATLVFKVVDNGVGIPKDKIEVIFKPFEQLDTIARSQGTGLGLPIVKSIVETKGGTISVDSEVGKGSVFTVKIPMRIGEDFAKVAESTAAQGGVASKVDFSHLRVLLIEDHPVNTLVAKRMLEKFGAVVDTAENGQVGYEKLVQSENGQYNVVFMDIQMPVMNGYECAKAIRTSAHPQARTIPIIATTANAFADDIQKSLDSGMNAHVVKPINIEAIARAVAEITVE